MANFSEIGLSLTLSLIALEAKIISRATSKMTRKKELVASRLENAVKFAEEELE